VEFGTALANHVGGTQGILAERVWAFRNQYAQESGLVVPRVRFVEDKSLGEEEYRITLFGDVVAVAAVQVRRTLAIHPTGERGPIAGVETREPTYGLPALWIEDDVREAARRARYTLVDPTTVLFTHLCEIVRHRSPELLTRSETERMLARVREKQPGLVEELIPTQLALSDVQKVLQGLLHEKVPVRNLQAIVEALIDGVRGSKDPAQLVERVRQRLALSICNSLSADRKTLQVLTLDPSVEDGLKKTLMPPDPAGDPSARRVDPRLLDTVLVRLAAGAEKMMKNNLVPVLLCTPDLRRHLRGLCERAAPHLRVISLAEVATGFELRAFATISAAPPPLAAPAPASVPATSKPDLVRSAT
jgi:flagellar biosynthesis protein FlhA